MHKMICWQCGSEIPDEMDFCYRCGAIRKYNDERGCWRCGSRMGTDEEFCKICGAGERPVSQFSSQKGMIAILLAAMPGFFDVFGLGHLYLKRFVTGSVFLCISVFVISIQLLYDLSEWNLYITVGTLLLFMIQLADIFRITSK